ncbi:MAG: sigma-70 family RNA polymerase sigma factor [Actinobacteria bacterium]|nr:sigma-70 family RNA polymerase sigma factor [Actinomycetota bacterium]
MRRRGATLAQLESLYRDRFEHFARVASAICGDLDRGRDVVQTAFVTAVLQRGAYRGTGALEAWVWRIVVTEARGVAREPQPEQLGVADSDSGVNGQWDDPLKVRTWIAGLPERQREALFLRYYADLDYRAIAEVLDIEIGTVSATLSAAHQTLRKRLREVRR